MNKRQEKLLIAALCGLVITIAGGFAAQSALAAGYNVGRLAQVTGVHPSDELNVRKWPAPYSQKIGGYTAGTHVWVDRCITPERGADWCLVGGQGLNGWVNSRYLTLRHDLDI